MRTSTGRFAVMVTLLLFYLTIRTEGKLTHEQPGLAQYLPRETLLYVEVPDRDGMGLPRRGPLPGCGMGLPRRGPIPGCGMGLPRRGPIPGCGRGLLGQLDVPPAVPIFTSRHVDLYAELDKTFAVGAGTSREVLRHLQGLYVVAQPVGPGRPAVVIVLELDTAGRAADATQKLGVPSNAGVPLAAGRSARLKSPSASVAAWKQFLIVARRPATVETFCEKVLVDRRGGASLADHPGFKRGLQQMRAHGAVWGFCSGPRVVQFIEQGAARNPRLPAISAALGLGGLRYGLFALTKADDYVTLKAEIEFDETFRLRRLVPAARGLSVMRRVPGTAFAGAAATLGDPPQFWGEVKRFVADLSAATGRRGTMRKLAVIDAVLGLGLKDSILSQLDGQVAFFITEPGATVSKKDWVVAARLRPVAAARDATKFETAARALMQRVTMGQPPRRKTVDGRTMYELTFRGARLHVSITETMVIVSGSERAAASYARWLRQGTKGQDLRTRAAAIYGPKAESTLACVVNVGTLASVMPQRLCATGKYDSFVLLDVSKNEGRIEARLRLDPELAAGMPPALLCAWLGRQLGVAGTAGAAVQAAGRPQD